MASGKKLLNYCMPKRYKQGTLYPTSGDGFGGYEKNYGNRKAKHAGHVRKAGQNKLRCQLKKELNNELKYL